MHVNIHWGNLDKTAYASNFEDILSKNIAKLKKFFAKIDSASIRLEIHLKYDPTKKSFSSVVHLITPKSNHHITESGFSLEESLNKSVANLKRKCRKAKEKKITLNRKKVV